jgi:surface protein
MGTIADKLTYLQGTKSAIKAAIEDKGVTVPTGTTFRDYADKIGEITSGGADEWVRPSDWLAMPTIGASEQKIVGLFAVYDTDANYVAFRCQGNYTVDWGDGTTTNHSSNTVAQKNYTYSSISSSTFSSRGYRQVLITITPQAGQNLTYLNLSEIDSTNRRASIPWLDLQVNTPNITSQSNFFIANNSSTIWLAHLERVRITAIGSLTSMANLFLNCTALKSVFISNTSAVTNMNGMFSGCISLETIPLFDTSLVTNMANMFNNCNSLKNVPLFNTANVTNMGTMFNSCSMLQSLPLLDTANVIIMSSFVNGCTSLQSLPLLDTANVNSAGFAFVSCRSLHDFPALDFNNITTAANMSNAFATTTLTRCRATNIKVSISFQNHKLSRTAIVEIFNNLATVTGQTITITGNFGAASLTTAERDIAINKGWTIVG